MSGTGFHFDQTHKSGNRKPRTMDIQNEYCLHCPRHCESKLDREAFTLFSGLTFLILGLICCLIQVISILCHYELNCYAVGLWCATAFLIPGLLSMKLYIGNRTSPPKWLIAYIVVDVLFAIVIPMVGAGLSSQCVQQFAMFVAIVLACVIGILTGTAHVYLLMRQLVHSRSQPRPNRFISNESYSTISPTNPFSR